MKTYINPKAIGESNCQKLQETFPEVEFVEHSENSLEVEVAIVMPDFFETRSLDQYPKLRYVQLLMAGYDKFDLKGAEARGITVCNAQDIFSITVSEDVMTKIFVLNRNVKHYLQAMAEGKWSPIRKEPELTGSTVGILGTGSIGKELAKRLKAFDVTVLGYRKNAGNVPYFDEIMADEEGLNRIFEVSDYIVVAIPLTKETHHLVNQKRLLLMKPTALLINVARGKVVDQDALVQALKQNIIRGAAIDVTDPEPLPQDSELWKLDNIYITPHNASSSIYMQDRLTDLAIANLHRYLKQQKLHYQISIK